jgi:hypothetical protein
MNKIAKIKKNKNIDDLNIDQRLLLRRVESRSRRSLRESIKIQSKKISFQYFINSKIERARLLREQKRA